MKTPNYRINYKEKNKYIIFVIIAIIIILLFVFKPLTWLKTRLSIKSMEYKSTHDPVYLSTLKDDKKKLPMSGNVTKSFYADNKGINIAPNTTPTEVRIIDIGAVVDIGYNDIEKNFVKIRHVSENQRNIYYSYYSNLPEKINLKKGEWVGSKTIIYSGNNLDYLHLEVIDINGNNINPDTYIKIE